MNFKLVTQSPALTETACVVLPVLQDGSLTPAGEALDKATESLVRQLIERGDFKARLGKTFLMPFAPGAEAQRILLVGMGEENKLTDSKFRKACQAAYDHLAQLSLHDCLITLADTPLKQRDSAWKLRLLAEMAETSFYRFTEFKSVAANEDLPTEINFWWPDNHEGKDGEKALAIGQAIGQGKNLARTLGNRPGNVCTPIHLADTALELITKDPAFTATILDEQQMAELGMNSLLSVGKGSDQPPRLIVVEYKGSKDPEARPHVLLGKGITFDTGGISLKPGEGMDEMKFDMCGAASVLGALEAVRQLKPKLNLVFMIAAAENMPSGRASKPGDIYTTLSGKTVEVLNTDAEGRLVLCDALTYAERFNPETVVDIATLTGACIIALGHQATGLLSNDEDLAAELLKAGLDAEDRAWQLPLWEEYQEQLDSNFADLQNIGGRPAGTITAACFLSRFAENFRWAHLDIAGTAWHSGKQKGATGRPVGLLVQYLLMQEASAEVRETAV
ncbi:leucyl aminopeptidase [Marinospirillum alkaliphilum]|uniref:Probable cytosol aminopeptidase n=1 Tax=Marinospirillum alkaliphilum DSM 21637 TaxID=1122209 RepID=A0A1K1V8B4_9GAMM|nr:leucyl aminopeptidase [Marinospirillum alkaliphilum]SFX21386.1 leucyl aminopeptidase [Marinospirillum alkaliphilum DSM 21637]